MRSPRDWLFVFPIAAAAFLPAQETAAPRPVSAPTWQGTWEGTVSVPGRGERAFRLFLETDGAPEKAIGTLQTDEGNGFLTGSVDPETERLELRLELFTTGGNLRTKAEGDRLDVTIGFGGLEQTVTARRRSTTVPAGVIERQHVFDPAMPRPIQVAKSEFAREVAVELERLVLDAMEAQNLVGLSLAIARSGAILDQRSYGFADFARRIPASEKTMYRWASISKPLTAVAALQISGAGKLDLDKDVRSYVPEWPEKDGTLTARLLLGNLAGVRHYQGTVRTVRSYDVAHPFADRILALDMFKDTPLAHAPGSKYLYSTHGFALLGAVIERAGEQGFVEQVQERIAKPLGMTTLQPDWDWESIPHRATGYHKDRTGRIVSSPTEPVAWKLPAGGWISTVGDLARFGMGFLADAVLSREQRELMCTPQRTADGKATVYGLGIGFKTLDGARLVQHSGSQNKTATLLVMDPERQLVIALMSNSYGARLGGLADAIWRLLAKS